MKSIRDLGVVHVVTKAQGGAENASLQESIRLSARYASAIKLLQGMGVPSAEAREGDADSGEQALQQTEELLHQSQQLTHRLQAVEKRRPHWNHGAILTLKIFPAYRQPVIR